MVVYSLHENHLSWWLLHPLFHILFGAESILEENVISLISAAVSGQANFELSSRLNVLAVVPPDQTDVFTFNLFQKLKKNNFRFSETRKNKSAHQLTNSSYSKEYRMTSL